MFKKLNEFEDKLWKEAIDSRYKKKAFKNGLVIGAIHGLKGITVIGGVFGGIYVGALLLSKIVKID